MKFENIPSPCYVIEEDLLRGNLEKIKNTGDRSGVEIIMALKAFAGWGVFPIIKEYIPLTTASSVNEARLSFEEMGTLTHSYAPVYKTEEFGEFMKYSSHITFNSLTQWEKHKNTVADYDRKISCGLRINPEYSVVDTGLYDPSSAGSRLGITSEQIGDKLPEGIEGLHFHNLCESDSYALEKILEQIEEKFGRFLSEVKWLNMGGGHLITGKDYDTSHLISLLKNFRKKYPNLHIIMEPGSAITWQTGVLISTVEDIVENHGIKTAILDVSFSCHMPDCLEMPYKPKIKGATEAVSGKPTYRMGGNSCLAGDFVGDWSFDNELKIGDRVIFEDMIHYTMVKTTTFNGVAHPSFGIIENNGNFGMIREFWYDDFKSKLS
ncbi:MAG: carboxynorspermidine decarboxylase [Rikenellaceae bacterium]|nr:carboxynorspermidine decarboxylase [Rikenellaceae bacterium]